MLFIILSGIFFSGIQPERPTKDFRAMEGTLITHHFLDISDTLSGPELFELCDDNGIPVWFGRHLFKDVCISGECKMIRLWLFWDGAGNYLGLQVPDAEPLTKSDHTEFEPADYKKLDEILHDTASVLKNLKQEDLIVVPDTLNPYEAYEVDGYTAATQPAISEAVVKDAVYSCHTLWHSVYGPVQDTIRKILDKRVNEDYLAKMLSGNKDEYICWAIESIKKHPEFHEAFYPDVMDYITSDNQATAKLALDYFQPAMLADTNIQLQLVNVMADTEMSIKYEILWKFIGYGKADEQAVLKLLQLFNEQKIGVGAYNLILRLITLKHLQENEQIASIIQTLSENENRYVKNLTIRLMENK